MNRQNVPDRTYTLDDLCTLAELPKRTVRYYIQLGLVDRPIGETRAAHYTSHHLEQLLQTRKWSEAGVSLDDRGAPRFDPETFETDVPGLFVAGGVIAGKQEAPVLVFPLFNASPSCILRPSWWKIAALLARASRLSSYR